MENGNRAFEVLHYRVKSESDMKTDKPSEATVRIRIGEKIEHEVAEGNGPVNALDIAFRKALEPYYPNLKDVVLKDFWVRINNGRTGTAASVEVLVICSNGDIDWSTQGFSTDIIKASAEALIKTFERAILFQKIESELYKEQ